ncbi:MAG: hypothetical protein ACREMB_20850 [Candidatus Rokuibacteriota bacterium]
MMFGRRLAAPTHQPRTANPLHPGNHLVVMPPHVAPPPPVPAPRITPAGRFQSIDDAMHMWTNDVFSGQYPTVRYPDEDVAHHGAHPRWERYQSSACWERNGTVLTLHGWYWLNEADGTWETTFQPSPATGTIWYDAQNNIDRFVLPAIASPAWSTLGWIKDEGSYGWIMRWQVVIEDPQADVRKKGGDVGWSGDARLADPGNQPPACPP